MRVAAVIPCRDEAATIARLLDALHQQSRLPDVVVVVDDGSVDHTAAVVDEWRNRHPTMAVRLLTGPGRGVAAAVNAGIVSSADADVIVRLDGHSAPDTLYIEHALETLAQPDVVVVGGVWVIEPGAATTVARAIARVVAHPLGSGGAAYRHAAGHRSPRPVDTVPFGVFRRELWRRLGGFDESLRANEDYDFNYRARLTGGTVLLDGRVQSVYRARPTLAALARQYHRYGYWKARMLAKDVRAIHPRQFIAGLVLPWVMATVGLALARGSAGAVLLAWMYPVAVVAVGGGVGVSLGSVPAMVAASAALATTHLCWSAGFLRGLARLPPPGDRQS